MPFDVTTARVHDDAAATAGFAGAPASPSFAMVPSAEPAWSPYAGIDVPSGRKAKEWSLVLDAIGIRHHVMSIPPVLEPDGMWRPGRLVLEVPRGRASEAQSVIDRYEDENRNFPPVRHRERLPHPHSLVVPLAFVALLVFFGLTGPAAAHSLWFERGTSVSSALGHEPWRAVTALTLHADGKHVLGNVLTGSLFAIPLARRIGPGGALASTVVAGSLGNLANAAAHEAMGIAHRSIGASTAVFAVVGLLAALQLGWNQTVGREAERSRVVRLAPLAGGLALLGLLGSGSGDGRTDLWAHLFGFLAGLVVGIVVVLARPHAPPAGHAQRSSSRLSALVQPAWGALAVGLVAGSWAAAMHGWWWLG
jgi:membrane associated rhomboid family serine protease